MNIMKAIIHIRSCFEIFANDIKIYKTDQLITNYKEARVG